MCKPCPSSGLPAYHLRVAPRATSPPPKHALLGFSAVSAQEALQGRAHTCAQANTRKSGSPMYLVLAPLRWLAARTGTPPQEPWTAIVGAATPETAKGAQALQSSSRPPRWLARRRRLARPPHRGAFHCSFPPSNPVSCTSLATIPSPTPAGYAGDPPTLAGIHPPLPFSPQKAILLCAPPPPPLRHRWACQKCYRPAPSPPPCPPPVTSRCNAVLNALLGSSRHHPLRPLACPPPQPTGRPFAPTAHRPEWWRGTELPIDGPSLWAVRGGNWMIGGVAAFPGRQPVPQSPHLPLRPGHHPARPTAAPACFRQFRRSPPSRSQAGVVGGGRRPQRPLPPSGRAM